MKEILIYTDGSGNNITKEGGFGVYNVTEKKGYKKGYTNTTTARMEIRAVLFALKTLLNEPSKVTIKLDNEYVVKSIQERWAYMWEMHKWQGRKNADLWQEVLKEIRRLNKVKITLQWIRGHQTNLEDEDVFYNNLVDKFADYKQFKNQEREEDV